METYKQSIYHDKQGVYIHVLKINEDDCAIIRLIEMKFNTLKNVFSQGV